MFLFSGPPFLVYAFWSFVALFLICVASGLYVYKKSKPNHIDATENTMDDNIDQSVPEPEEGQNTPTTSDSELESATEEPIRTSTTQTDIPIAEGITLPADSVLKISVELDKVAMAQKLTDIAELAREIKFSEDVEEEEVPISDVLREAPDSPYNDDDWDANDKHEEGKEEEGKEEDDDDDGWDDDDDDDGWDDDDDNDDDGGSDGGSPSEATRFDEFFDKEFQKDFAYARA